MELVVLCFISRRLIPSNLILYSAILSRLFVGHERCKGLIALTILLDADGGKDQDASGESSPAENRPAEPVAVAD